MSGELTRMDGDAELAGMSANAPARARARSRIGGQIAESGVPDYVVGLTTVQIETLQEGIDECRKELLDPALTFDQKAELHDRILAISKVIAHHSASLIKASALQLERRTKQARIRTKKPGEDYPTPTLEIQAVA